MAEHAIAVLVDFENMARPGAKSRGDFDINLVLNRLAEKGRVLVKRAYADWGRYREAKVDLQNAGLELIEMPSAREGAKNRADIKLAVDAMELAYSRDHLDNFVIVSGDSDFTPLVGKLRELNKRVTGMGNKESASDLLIANCDEFIFYDTIAATAGGRSVRRGGRSPADPVALLQETLTALAREGVEAPLSSVVKDSIRRKHPAFDEADQGFGTFSKFLEDAAKKGIIRLETDPRSGTYRVEMADGAGVAAAPAPAAAGTDEPRENGEGRRRRRRRRVEGPPATSEAPAADGGEIFEFVVTPRGEPQPDLSELPPIDQPISYEDMILLGPEIGEDVPDLAEATDTPAAAPARGSRRRRRRTAEPEPTVADLEPVDDELAAAVAEAELLATVELAEEVAEVLAEEEVAEAVAEVLAEEALVEAATDPEPPAGGSRRRVRRGSTRAAALAEAEPVPAAVAAEAPSDEEAPAPRRRTRRKAAAPEAAAETAEAPAAAEEAPKPKRRTRRKAAEPEAAAETAEAPAAEAEEAPKPKRRTRRKAAAPEAAAETAEAPAAEAEEAPKPRRRTRRKAADEVPAEA